MKIEKSAWKIFLLISVLLLILDCYIGAGGFFLGAVYLLLSERKKLDCLLGRGIRNKYATLEGIIVTDINGFITEVNSNFENFTGYSKEEIIGKKPSFLKSGEHDSYFYKEMWQEIKSKGRWTGLIENKHKSGKRLYGFLSINEIKNRKNEKVGYIGMVTDASSIKRDQKTLKSFAFLDSLTGLYNRHKLNEVMEELERNKSKEPIMLAFMDLDGFKPINDMYGHATGDQILVEISNRLKKYYSENVKIFRVGGDEFVLVVSDLSDGKSFMERVLLEIANPIKIEDVEHKVSASAGITYYPSDNEDWQTLLRHADSAMYEAKGRARGACVVYSSEEAKNTLIQKEDLSKIRSAILNDNLVLHFQPKIKLSSWEVTGFESLVRMKEGENLIYPDEFITQIIGFEEEIMMGEWVFKEAVAQLEKWNKTINNDWVININISPNYFLSSVFLNNLELKKELSGQIELEILETDSIDDYDLFKERLKAIHDLGYRSSLDDFGTGYSSLTHFRKLKVDGLKIDKSFVIDMVDDEEDRKIVKSISEMAALFGIPVTAEGVESSVHMNILSGLKCDYAQGYWISKAMPSDSIMDWLKMWEINKEKFCGELVDNICFLPVK